MHGVGSDAVGGELDGCGLGEDADGALGGVVHRAGVVCGDDAELGGDVDDGAAACRLHLGDGRLRAEEDALGVDVHDKFPVFDRSVFDQAADASDAGVVDEDMQRTEA